MRGFGPLAVIGRATAVGAALLLGSARTPPISNKGIDLEKDPEC